MASPAIVEVVERCRIAPPPGSVPTTTLPLTYLDLPWFMVPPVERVFFYESHHSKDYFFDTVLPNLKHSLSVTLQHFFPLVGNLTWPQDSLKPEIVYKEGDTISLTVAESTHGYFQSLSGNHARPAEEFYHLVPSFAARSPTDTLIPLMCLQVTFFPGSGICIGISVNHVCADGRTSNHFLKSWASVCRSQGDDASVLSALPVYDRPTLPYHQEREQVLIKENERIVNVTKETLFNTPASPPPQVDKVRATLVMRRFDISMLRHWVMPRVMTKGLRLSSFALTCANVWVSWIKSQLDRDTNYRELFGFPVDCRDQLTPPLPTTYFGNCFGFGIAVSTTDELVRENGVAIAAEVIVKGIQETRSDMWGSCERLYAEVPTGVRTTTESMRMMTVAGSPKLSVYETDFGWGKPKKVEVISIGERGSISLSESPTEEGALEIGLVGSKEGIDAFTTIYVNNLSTLSSHKPD